MHNCLQIGEIIINFNFKYNCQNKVFKYIKRIFIGMKDQSRRQSRQKVKEKKKRVRKNTMDPIDKLADTFIETIEEYTVHFSQCIGEGTYGKVYKANKQGSKQQFACKFINKDRIQKLQLYYQDQKVAQQFEQRLKRQGQFQMKLSKCPFIAKLYKAQKNQKGFFFIMEYCDSDLAKLLKKEGFLTQGEALRYFKQTIQGIKYIYLRNAFHRDLKPQNLLLKNDTIKISDFGFVKIFSQIDKQCKSRRQRFQTHSKVGTFRYMSPDILALLSAQNKQNTGLQNLSKSQSDTGSHNQNGTQNSIQSKYNPEKSDVWSLGIILYKMLYGKEPYDGKSFQDMIKKINQQKLDFPGSIEFPPGKIVKINVSKQIIKLIKKMLTVDQNDRIDFMKLYSKFNLFLQEKQKQKIRSGIEPVQQTSKKTSTQQVGINKKQRLLTVYNKIIIRIYKDLSTFATLREIGIQNYSQFSYKIMTLLHQKRTSYYQSQEQNKQNQAKRKKKKEKQKIQIDEKVKQQISQYHNVFYNQIKGLSNLKSDETLENLLLKIYECLTKYEDFQLLIKQVQLFLLFLLQLLCLQRNIIKEDYICATEDKAQSLKIKSILNFKNDAIKLILDSLNGGQSKQQNIKESSKQRTNSKDKHKSTNKTDKIKQRLQSKPKQRKQKSSKKQHKKQGKQAQKQ